MPGSRASASLLAGNSPPCSATTSCGAAMQVARAAVVAEPAPGGQHVVERRRGERAHVGKSRQEALVVAEHRRHLGLLQHDLGQPDAVRIARALPRQPVPAVHPLPVDDASRKARCGVHRLLRRHRRGRAFEARRRRRHACARSAAAAKQAAGTRGGDPVDGDRGSGPACAEMRCRDCAGSPSAARPPGSARRSQAASRRSYGASMRQARGADMRERHDGRGMLAQRTDAPAGAGQAARPGRRVVRRLLQRRWQRGQK